MSYICAIVMKSSQHMLESSNDTERKSDAYNETVDEKLSEVKDDRGRLVHMIYTIRNNKTFRWKFFTATSLLWAFALLGWTSAQMGPSFLDLQIITGASIDDGSLYFTFNAGGYLVGSFITGFIYDKTVHYKPLVIAVTQIGNAAILMAIPWCTKHELMVFTYALKGIFGGGFETCGNAHLIHVCGNDNAALMQALYFAFGVGGIVSPYAISPFLVTERNGYNDDSAVVTTDFLNKTSSQNIFTHKLSIAMDEVTVGWTLQNTSQVDFSNSNDTMVTTLDRESRLYIGFSITSLLNLTSAIPFCILFLKSRQEKVDERQKRESVEPSKKYNSRTIVLVIVMSTIMGLYCGIEDAFNKYLATFCVKQLKWTKANAATITSVYWASVSIGRGAGIFFITFFRPSRTVVVLYFLLSVSHVGFLLTSQFQQDEGVWIFGILVGLSCSVIFPLLFTWMEGDIIKVTGKIASLLMIVGSAGATINPILVGYTMDNYIPLSLGYILVSETALSFLLCLIVLVSSTEQRSNELETNIPETLTLQTVQDVED